ncbi:MAG: type II toxin-antitoxin system RelE/ParE family toxin [Rhodospirillales bacterium]|nr:type II toxin-antitoxin system RelE/ParE family toxin [Rhodospirillales bacterium]
MLHIVVLPKAQADIVDIAAYTLENWGERRMTRYVDSLHARFVVLARQPEIGRRRDDIGPGYRSIVHGSHIVFYRLTRRELVIVRVLHGRMSSERHIP